MKADRPRLRRGALAPLGVALIAGLVLSACGGSSSGSGTSASAKTGSSPSGATGASGSATRRSALAACLKQHGVTLPSAAGRPGGFGASGRSGPSGASGFRRFGASGASGFHRFGASGASGFGGGGFLGGNSKDAAAFKACAADVGGGSGPGGFARPSAGFSASSTADRTAVTNYVACVRKHGYDLPNPNFSGKGPVFSTTQVNRSSAKFIAANSACESLLKFSGGGGT